MKKIKLFNTIINASIIVFALILNILDLSNGDIKNSIIKLSIIPIVLIIPFLRKTFKFKIPYILETIITIFVFLSYYIGYVLKVYDVINGYDKVVHTILGLVTSLIALYLLKKNNKVPNKLWFNILFIIGFTFFIACIWEFLEFGTDKILKKDEQSVLKTGVDDTMYDLLVAFVGAVLFNIMYLIEVKCNKNLLITKYLKIIKY